MYIYIICIYMYSALDDLYGRQDQVARALFVAFAEMLSLDKCTFLQHFEGGDDLGTIRLMQYPQAKDSDEAEERLRSSVGISAHTDFEFFTLMHQDSPGLQLLCRQHSLSTSEDSPRMEEVWVDAPVVPGAFMVIAGDVFERFTNGVIRAMVRLHCTLP